MKNLEESFDVVVVGGGFAGAFAAISAARMGCRAALVQDRSMLGGNGSSEIGVGIAGADVSGTGLVRYARETGLIDEYALELLHSAATPQGTGPLRSVVLWDMARREKGLSVYLNAAMRQADLGAGGAIESVLAYQHSTERHYRFRGRYFIDCTGHGTLGAAVGAEFRMGREGREEFRESFAPPAADAGTMGCTVTFHARDVGRPVPFVAPPWAVKFPTDDDLPHRHKQMLVSQDKDEMVGFWWLAYGGAVNDIDDSEAIHDELLRIAFGLWDHMKNTGDHGVANWELTWLCPLPAPRESRRLIGDAIPTEHDVVSRTAFPDRVAYAGWSIDLHPPEGIYSKLPPNRGLVLSGLWNIPFRSLYSRDVPNLLMAGRDASVSHVALGSSRVIATCALMGQAAGTAAAICCREGCSPRQLAKERIEQLQRQLLRDDCYLVDMPLREPQDLAQGAAVTASSEAAFVAGAADDWQELDAPWAQLFPVSADRLEAVELLLRSALDAPAAIRLGLRAARHVNDFEVDATIVSCEAVVPPRGEGWVRFSLSAVVEPGRFYWIHLPAQPGLAWALQRRAPHGTNRARWSAGEGKRWESVAPVGSPDYQRGMLLLRLSPESRPYGPGSVLTGVNRPEKYTNLWVSDAAQELPQWIELSLPEDCVVSEVHITFDDDLDRNIYHPRPWGRLGEGTMETLVRDYRLLAWADGQWRELLTVAGNYQRCRRHRFEPVRTRRVRLECLATHGAPEARVYGIRLYGPG